MADDDDICDKSFESIVVKDEDISKAMEISDITSDIMMEF